MMEHVQAAQIHHAVVAGIARSFNPDVAASIASQGFAGMAIVSIVARGNWMLVNGRWLRKQQDGVCL